MIIQHVNFLYKDKRACCKKNRKVAIIDDKYLKNECINKCFYYTKHEEEMGKDGISKIVCSWEDFFEYKYGVVGIYNPDLELKRLNEEPTENEVAKNNENYINEKFKYYNSKELHILNPIVQRVKNCDKCTRRDEKREACLINPFQTFTKLEYLQPYTTNYWTDQCFNYPADIAILGQDWGSATSVIKYNEKGRNELSNETRGNLGKGINKRIKCKDRAVFINSVMCLREGNDTDNEGFNKKFIGFCKDNIIGHLNIVKPKIIITMGKEVSKTYIADIKNSEPVYKFASKPYYDVKNGWYVFPIYHLGNNGQKLGRDLYKSKSDLIIGDFLKDFDLIKWLLISYYLGQILVTGNNAINNIEVKLVKNLPKLSKEITSLCNSKINLNKFNLKQGLPELILRLYAELTNSFVYNNELDINSLKISYTENNLTYNINKIINTLNTNKVYWLINGGERNRKIKERYWEDNVEFGFISLGHGDINSKLLKKVNVGHYVFAYISKCGYVGYGKVKKKAMMYKDSNLYKEVINKQINIKNEDFMKENINDINNCEYILEIDWLKNIDKINPIPKGKMYVSPSTLCRLHKPTTITQLIYEFGLR